MIVAWFGVGLVGMTLLGQFLLKAAFLQLSNWLCCSWASHQVSPGSGSHLGGPLWSVSTVGLHLTQELKGKIWHREFINILTLVPLDKETVDKARRIDVTSQGEKSKQLPRTFGNWLQSFCAYAGMLCEKFLELGPLLFGYVDLIW